MPLYGTLKTMPLTDLVQWLGSARRSGTLQVERKRVHKCIVFEAGRIQGCSSDEPSERLGHFLLSRGRITEEQLRIALAAQEASGKFLGRIFVEMGALTDAELTSLLEAKAEEIIFSLFDWEDAVFRFHEDRTPDGGVFPVNLRVEDVLLRGVQRFDEIQRIRSVFNDPGIVLERTGVEPPAEVLRNSTAQALYRSIDGERTVADILLHVHGSEYLVTRFLYELHRNGFVEIVGVRSVEAAADPGLESVLPPELALPDPGKIDLQAAPAAAPTIGEPLPPQAAPAEAPRDVETPAPPQRTIAPEPAGTAVAEPQSPAPVAATVTSELPAPPPSAETSEGPAAESEDLEIPDLFVESSDLEPVEQSIAHQVVGHLEMARGLMANGEYDQALEILDDLYRRYPDDDALRKLLAEAEVAFKDMAYRHYLPANRIPVLALSPDQIEAQNLSPSEFFLLSRIDGTWDVKSIIQITPLREIEALLTLKRLREKGLIDLRECGD